MPKFNHKANTKRPKRSKTEAMLKKIKKKQPGRYGGTSARYLPARITIPRTVRKDIEDR